MASTGVIVAVVVVILAIVLGIYFWMKKKKKETIPQIPLEPSIPTQPLIPLEPSTPVQEEPIMEGFIDVPQKTYIDDPQFKQITNARLRAAGLRAAGITPSTPTAHAGTHELAKRLLGPYSNEQFMTRPTFRADVPPRFYNGQYQSEIRGALPPTSVRANPRGSMDLEPPLRKMGGMSEGYAGIGGSQMGGLGDERGGMQARFGHAGGMAKHDAFKSLRRKFETGDTSPFKGMSYGKYQSIDKNGEGFYTARGNPLPGRGRSLSAGSSRMSEGFNITNPSLTPSKSPRPKYDFAQVLTNKGTESPDGLSENAVNTALYSEYQDPLEYVDPQDVLPSEDMSSLSYGKKPSDPDTYVYDRLIYANQRRRGLEGADFIRGDLPIAPDNRGWFQVSVKPHLDLRKGAVGWQIGPDYNTEQQSRDIQVDSARANFDVKMQRFS